MTFRLYTNGYGITHYVAWDDGHNEWYYVCNVRYGARGKKEHDADEADLPFANCLRCIWRADRPIVSMDTETTGLLGYINPHAVAKLHFDYDAP